MNDADRLTQLQIQQQEEMLKQMKADRKSKAMSRFASGMKHTGQQLVKLVKPTRVITQKENFNMMFGRPGGVPVKKLSIDEQNNRMFMPDPRLKNQESGLGKKRSRFI